jgi:23S rRNA pseudouridine2605 synthase
MPIKQQRLSKIIASSGYCSRREAEKLIENGLVKVNNQIVSTQGVFVDNQDVITINNQKINTTKIKTRFFLYHKPKGLITSYKDNEGRQTIFDTLPKNLPKLISIGRLDYNSEGLLLLTTNGMLSNLLTSKELKLKRIYKVRVLGQVSQKELQALEQGITINEIHYEKIIAKILIQKGANIWLEFILEEGKNREIRNICEFLGLQVSRLLRTNFGSFALDSIPPHSLKEISQEQLMLLLTKDLLNANYLNYSKTEIIKYLNEIL